MTDAPTDFALAQDTRNQYERYAVALTFSILGLAVPTGHFGISVTADVLELVAWLSLLMSGLVGLSRLERIPWFYELSHNSTIIGQERLKRYRMRARGGEMVPTSKGAPGIPMADALKQIDQQLAENAAMIEKTDRSLDRRYRVERGLFLVGLLALVAARATVPLVGLSDLLRHRPAC